MKRPEESPEPREADFAPGSGIARAFAAVGRSGVVFLVPPALDGRFFAGAKSRVRLHEQIGVALDERMFERIDGTTQCRLLGFPEAHRPPFDDTLGLLFEALVQFRAQPAVDGLLAHQLGDRHGKPYQTGRARLRGLVDLVLNIHVGSP
ncbi:hypothetical protein [Caballeronia telluris]|uniref:hypothetical protein n=1 Tax=Caballeronia telluris TaxID=326475 RepID=UPI00190E6F29|nr:hypothetical protein [Caballeronia telluris]